ncbi:hypothetical protein FPV67DRAFT_295251 [Lyophyllum atratum]|nr:hypothetical protein FPV67DRAFT_295251 [Lyophyllum atratum]
MPQRPGLGVLRWITVPTLFLQAARAFKLQIPPDTTITLGDTIAISWTTALTDPPRIDFAVACANGRFFPLPGATNIDTKASPLAYTVGDLPRGPNPPFTCILQAIDSRGTRLELDRSGPITINPKGSPKPPVETSSSDSPTSSDNPTSIPTSPSSTITPPESTFESTRTSETGTPDQSTSATLTSIFPPADSSNTLTTSATSSPPSGSSSTSSPAGSAPTFSATNATSKPRVGAIVGGVVGGILALLLVIVLLLLCRRRRRRLQRARHLQILRGVDPGAPVPTPIFLEKEDWSARVDDAMAEAAKQSERARSRAGSNQKLTGNSALGHYTDGYQSPDPMNAKIQHESQPDPFAAAAPALSTRAHSDDEWESHDHLYTSHSESDSASLAAVGLEPGGAPWGQDSLDDFGRKSATDGPDITKMDPEARERRREEILEQMRKVLDGQQEPRYVAL